MYIPVLPPIIEETPTLPVESPKQTASVDWRVNKIGSGCVIVTDTVSMQVLKSGNVVGSGTTVIS